MTGPRTSETQAGGRAGAPASPRIGGRPARAGGLPASAAPHGYDHAEFAPNESRRDFPPRRPRVPDEERRLLKAAEAAFEGPDRRPDADSAAHPWDRDGGEHLGGAPADGKPSPRLYRE
ncbi:hypothetical protein EZH22_05630 [Xanthobacter dioxanivorans]|uniref:Uncharacterized protein n=1 Tax=Xanthobacter dioxanivorans TaxID=2528964 RepID=A0A974SIY4_9HYPH|nr:hypothetical protein [Xanthobacter dioxanivorans]QRG07856.1 hypothetical protein EZH22_05630 [Xanthobacter dioxanivorans]